jgi:DNA-directed RNA polymerase specialized sigma subunit
MGKIKTNVATIAPGVLGREEVLSLLAERMAKLPEIQKKVLAMHYCENMTLLEIAARLGQTKSGIRHIHTQAVGLVRTYLKSLRKHPKPRSLNRSGIRPYFAVIPR